MIIEGYIRVIFFSSLGGMPFLQKKKTIGINKKMSYLNKYSCKLVTVPSICLDKQWIYYTGN